MEEQVVEQIVYENVVKADKLKKRYHGFPCFIMASASVMALIMVVTFVVGLFSEYDSFLDFVSQAKDPILALLLFAGITALMLVPIVLRTPKEELAKTILHAYWYGVKGYLKFCLCLFIFGFFLHFVKYPDTDYTVYVNGEKIPVTLIGPNLAEGRDGTLYRV